MRVRGFPKSYEGNETGPMDYLNVRPGFHVAGGHSPNKGIA
jgi:hypothetical protein